MSKEYVMHHELKPLKLKPLKLKGFTDIMKRLKGIAKEAHKLDQERWRKTEKRYAEQSKPVPKSLIARRERIKKLGRPPTVCVPKRGPTLKNSEKLFWASSLAPAGLLEKNELVGA
jgi:hypothetical protein